MESINEIINGTRSSMAHDDSNCTTHECSGECTFCFAIYFALRKGRRHISLPILGCGGPGHVAAKHLSVSSVSIEEFLEGEQECKNVTSSQDQKDLVNLVLESRATDVGFRNGLLRYKNEISKHKEYWVSYPRFQD